MQTLEVQTCGKMWPLFQNTRSHAAYTPNTFHSFKTHEVMPRTVTVHTKYFSSPLRAFREILVSRKKNGFCAEGILVDTLD